jgi:hypothetical protein
MTGAAIRSVMLPCPPRAGDAGQCFGGRGTALRTQYGKPAAGAPIEIGSVLSRTGPADVSAARSQSLFRVRQRERRHQWPANPLHHSR